MAGYIIGEIEITDPAIYETYRPLAAASVARHGGRFIVRGGAATRLEGQGDPKRVVVMEFPSLEAARAFYESEDYQVARKVRLASSRGRLLLVEGL